MRSNKVGEVVKLRVEDTDVEREMIRIRSGKGKERQIHDAFRSGFRYVK